MRETMQLSMETLEWVAAKTGSTLQGLAQNLYTRNEVVSDIVKGYLTPTEIRKISEYAKVPFGFLFLQHPPQAYSPDISLVDFRTVNNSQPLSKDFIEIYKDIEHKQTWYLEYLSSIDAPKLEFVGRFKDNSSYSTLEVAENIRKTIGISNIAANIPNSEDYYNALVSYCEDIGILIFKNSMVINSTRRLLNTDEFRGFVIADEYAPVVFINGNDAKYANIFTLAHELAHIWLGESGISDVDVRSNNAAEIRCNAIAAEVLAPTDEFIQRWNNLEATLRQKISALNKYFKVSELAIARIALVNERIPYDLYNDIYAETMERVRIQKAKNKDKEVRLPLRTMLPIKNSRRLTETILGLMKNNSIGPSEAATLLNTSAAKVISL